MSGSPPRLPARPSLEQLRKQAKERLEALRATDPSATLAAAQYAVARDYGFESWPRLVHHVDAVRSAGGLDEYERLAKDILAAYQGDDAAVERLIAHFGVSYNTEQWRLRIRSHVDDARGVESGDPRLADIELMLARENGFASGAAFAQ